MNDAEKEFAAMDNGLLKVAVEAGSGTSIVDVEDWIDNPRWDLCGKFGDWRNHVPEEIRELWSKLSRETRLAVYAISEEGANSESDPDDWN